MFATQRHILNYLSHVSIHSLSYFSLMTTGSFSLGEEEGSFNIVASSLRSEAVFGNKAEKQSSCFYFPAICFAGWILFVIATWCGLVCSHGWNASREEIQQCLVWRYGIKKKIIIKNGITFKLPQCCCVERCKTDQKKPKQPNPTKKSP